MSYVEALTGCSATLMAKNLGGDAELRSRYAQREARDGGISQPDERAQRPPLSRREARNVSGIVASIGIARKAPISIGSSRTTIM